MYLVFLDFINFIVWDVSPQIFNSPVRWYGLFFATGFIAGQAIMKHIFKAEGKPESDVDTLTYYMVAATVLGARLGHCFFYEPEYYLNNPIEILMVWKGGLASHGATIGIIVALFFYAKNKKDQSWLWILDRIVITVALAGSLIRLGNLMNSEIIGKPTGSSLGFVFVHNTKELLLEKYSDILDDISFHSLERDTVVNKQSFTLLKMDFFIKKNNEASKIAIPFAESHFPDLINSYSEPKEHFAMFTNYPKYTIDSAENIISIQIWAIPRHASMVYESISTFLLFLLLYFLWMRRKKDTPEGSLFGLFVVILFSLRLIYEFFKENQVDFEDNLALNMGQLLSIPLIIGGIIVLLRSYLRKPKSAS